LRRFTLSSGVLNTKSRRSDFGGTHTARLTCGFILGQADCMLSLDQEAGSAEG
jgi:hypothetical protein